MRIYHPDRNDDPRAQARAREITAAFAVLGDPARRADYDAREASDDGSMALAGPWGVEGGSPPPMRNLGLASIAVALAVSLAFALPSSRPEPEPQALHSLFAYRGAAQPSRAEPARPAMKPVSALPQRIAAAAPSAPVSLPTARTDTIAVQQARSDREPTAPKAKAKAKAPKVAMSAPPPAAPARPPARAAAKPAPAPQPDGRRVEVERLATGFLNQSLQHADWHKQQLLLSARNRAATSRNLCSSEDCVTEAYLRQIRDTTTIMEGRIPGN
jgi:hypothetical protein